MTLNSGWVSSSPYRPLNRKLIAFVLLLASSALGFFLILNSHSGDLPAEGSALSEETLSYFLISVLLLFIGFSIKDKLTGAAVLIGELIFWVSQLNFMDGHYEVLPLSIIAYNCIALFLRLALINYKGRFSLKSFVIIIIACLILFSKTEFSIFS